MQTAPHKNHLMEQPPSHQTNGIITGAIAIFVTLLLLCTGIIASLVHAEETVDDEMTLPVIAAETHGLQPLFLDNENPSRHQPDPRLPALVQQLPNIAAPDNEVTQQITIRNDEAHTRRITVTQQLPVGLEPATDTDWNPKNIHWNPAQRQWTWTGEIAGGDRDYTIDPSTIDIPYLDLATFGVVNLCDQFAETDQNDVTSVSCDDETMTLNIGRQGQSVLLYGMAWRSLTLHADGFVSFGDGEAQSTAPQILPHQDRTVTLAPLHADLDLSYTATPTSTTQIGRWHAAVIADYLDGRDTLFVQWHNAPLATDPDATARVALAIPLWSDDGTPPEIETAFHIYDNISHPSRFVAADYSIGVQDGAGERGMSYAHSVAGDVQGYPPSPSVLRLLPVRYGDLGTSMKTLTFRWQVSAAVPTNLVSTVELTSDSQQSPLTQAWATAYLAVRHQTYLPILKGNP